MHGRRRRVARPTRGRPPGLRSLVDAIDQLGSVRDVAAAASGQKLNHFDYDPYGNPTTATGSRADWTDLRYAGLFYHQPSGLYLATYRAYDPIVGRWLDRDPIGEQGGVNLYAYVGGNPLSWKDPAGLYWILVPLGGLGPNGVYIGIHVPDGGSVPDGGDTFYGPDLPSECGFGCVIPDNDMNQYLQNPPGQQQASYPAPVDPTPSQTQPGNYDD